MKTMKTILKDKKIKEVNLKVEFKKELKDEGFEKYVSSFNCDFDLLTKHASKLKDSYKEFSNCLDCPNLNMCKNELDGYCYTPTHEGDSLIFSYKPCRYMQRKLENEEYKENISLYSVPKCLQDAKVKDIYTDDKSRIEIIIYINEYIEAYFKNRKKGVYLTGNFGSGKTYLIAALFNELAKKDVHSAIIYFPEFLRGLKSSFNESSDGSYSDKFNYIKKVPLLLIDDIGAENITTWARDEILGTLLQYRMEENLPTFFTSNLTLDELEIHLSITGNNVEKVKARRIIERIKYLADEMKLIGVDRRKN